MNTKLMMALAIAALAINCTGPMQSAGGSSDSGNPRVVASIRNQNGSLAVGALVRLRKSDYVAQPPLSMTKPAIYAADALTDDLGMFEIKGIDPGTYCIEVNDPSTGSGRGGTVLFTLNVAAKDTLTLGSDTLRSFAMVSGSFDMSAMPGKTLYVQVVGLERLVRVDSMGAFTIRDLPAGHFILHTIATQGTQTTLVRADSVTVAAGDSVLLSMPGWKFSRKVYLNTTAAGAGVSGTVSNFPVLIRLTNSNFDFSRAKANGDDLRFTTPNGAAIPFEIDRWDAANSQAEIWVKIDTVFGNDNAHYFYMSWGNPNAVSASNGTTVFDTTQGFQGVWHLSDPIAGPVKDATPNGYNGVATNLTGQAVVNAMVGNGRSFAEGDSGYVTMPGTASSKLNFPENGIYAVSAWVYIDSLDSAGHAFVTKGDQQYNLEVFRNRWEFAEFKTSHTWEMSSMPALAKRWTFLMGVRNQGKQYLFVDGQLVDTISEIQTNNNANRSSLFNVMFGKTDGYPETNFPYYFHGMLDEIRLLNVAPNADWIKLCYMNQKLPDALIGFK